MKYWIEKDGRWESVFITSDDPETNVYNDLIGSIYNLRRPRSHKRIRLCWENLRKYKVNPGIYCEMNQGTLEKYEGPFNVYW